MQCWPLCSCLTDVYVCTSIPFPAPVSAWQERGPEYSQPDVAMTAAPFRSYMTLLVQALLLKLVRITLPYLGNPHPKSSSSREGSRAGHCHLTRPMESVFLSHNCLVSIFSLRFCTLGVVPVRLAHGKCANILSDHLPAPSLHSVGTAGGPSGRLAWRHGG